MRSKYHCMDSIVLVETPVLQPHLTVMEVIARHALTGHVGQREYDVIVHS